MWILRTLQNISLLPANLKLSDNLFHNVDILISDLRSSDGIAC